MNTKDMRKAISITFAISLILGLSLGFIIGAGTVIFVGKDMVEDFVEENEINVLPALIFEVNQTTIKNYTKDLINTSEIKEDLQEIIMNKIKQYGD